MSVKKYLFISYKELELLTEGKDAQVLKKLKVSVMFQTVSIINSLLSMFIFVRKMF